MPSSPILAPEREEEVRSLLFDVDDSEEITSLTKNPLDLLISEFEEEAEVDHEESRSYALVFEREMNLFKAHSKGSYLVNPARIRALTSEAI